MCLKLREDSEAMPWPLSVLNHQQFVWAGAVHEHILHRLWAEENSLSPDEGTQETKASWIPPPAAKAYPKNCSSSYNLYLWFWALRACNYNEALLSYFIIFAEQVQRRGESWEHSPHLWSPELFVFCSPIKNIWELNWQQILDLKTITKQPFTRWTEYTWWRITELHYTRGIFGEKKNHTCTLPYTKTYGLLGREWVTSYLISPAAIKWIFFA